MSSTRTVHWSALLVVVLTGCYQDFQLNDPDGSPPPWDAGTRFVPPPGPCTRGTPVDLLFVVDNSNSTAAVQRALTDEFPALVTSLVEPPDEDGDGEPDWLPVEDLRVGVVTADMGTGAHRVPTCSRSDFGDDGVLIRRGTDLPGCAPEYPAPLVFEPASGVAPEGFAQDVSCVANVGTRGCGFEQPLEAMLKALSPATATNYTSSDYRSPRFFRDSLPHGLGANDGFVRRDSLLMVVLVTDEDDCSAADPDLFNPGSFVYGATDLNLRCFAHPEALHSVRRYVDGLIALRAQRPDLLALALLAGVPSDLTLPVQTDANFDEILRDPRMQREIDPRRPDRLLPSCVAGDGRQASPPHRLVEVARGLGAARTTVQSICEDDFAPTRRAIARLIGRRSCSTRD